MKTIGIIPARYDSTRFPGKPLHLIAGKPLIQHVVERCREASALADVIVATDDEQGDEPLIKPEVIDAVAGALSDAEMTTAATVVNNISELDDPNAVKVVVSATGRALYFSRRTIPFLRDLSEESPSHQLSAFPFLKHLGIYGYRCETLQRLVSFTPSALEQAERLEQLRALENDIAIAVCKVDYDAIGVDVPADVQRVEAMLAEQNE